MDCPRLHKNLVEATTGKWYLYILLVWVIEIYFTRENYLIIKTTSFKTKEKSSKNTAPKERN